jgi:hypothetical protein
VKCEAAIEETVFIEKFKKNFQKNRLPQQTKRNRYFDDNFSAV